MAIVSIENLTKQYSNHRGIRDVSFSIAKGEVLGLLGPNGSGKTTIMKIMTGLLKPDSGTLRIFGMDPLVNSPTIMAKSGCMIEQPGLYLYLTAEQNLHLISRFYPNITSKRIDDMLEIVELNKYRNEKVQKFSMGMKQRLALAMALLSNPDLLVLDEPTNNMDISGAALVREILKREMDNGCTILLSSHLAHEIEHLCTNVVVLKDGEVIDRANVGELKNEHGSVEKYYLATTKQRRRGTDEFVPNDLPVYKG